MTTQLLNTVAMAVQRTGRSRTALYQAMKDDELAYVQLGSRRFITEDALVAYVERLTAEGASPHAPEAA